MRIVYLFFCILFSSCSAVQTPSMPQLVPVAEMQKGVCERSFVSEDWQFVHSIHFEQSSGHGITLVGITVLQDKKLKTVLMGVEGFVLFEAEQKVSGQVLVSRAMPPFDRTGFAEGLMADVRALFVAPECIERIIAKNPAGEQVCRYTSENNQITDVVTASQGWNRIEQYDRKGILQKAITAKKYKEVDGKTIPEQIVLTALGARGYTLQLQLLSAEKI